jgi:hypothetical protein
MFDIFCVMEVRPFELYAKTVIRFCSIRCPRPPGGRQHVASSGLAQRSYFNIFISDLVDIDHRAKLLKEYLLSG